MDAEDGIEEDTEEDAEENLITNKLIALLTLFFLFSYAVTSADIGEGISAKGKCQL